jgi:hypothetical protein
MFSNQQQQDFNIENPDHNLFINNPRSRNSFSQQPQPQQPQQSTSSSYHNMHHNNSFGPMAINPSSTVQGSGQNNIPFTDPSSANWFGTSMDSNASSFGQSPVFGGRDLLVTPSNSTGHIIDSFNGGDDEDLGQRK